MLAFQIDCWALFISMQAASWQLTEVGRSLKSMHAKPLCVQDDFINRNHVCNCFDSTLVDHSFNNFNSILLEMPKPLHNLHTFRIPWLWSTQQPTHRTHPTTYKRWPMLAPRKSCLPRDTKRWVCVQRPVTPGTSGQTVLVEPHATNLRGLSWTIRKLLLSWTI